MLQPKRTKFRRSQKGRMKGNAQRGNQLAFGSFGIKALEEKWIEGLVEGSTVASFPVSGSWYFRYSSPALFPLA